MDFSENHKKRLFEVTEESFSSVSLEVFNYQYHNNSIYKNYCDSLNINVKEVNTIQKIPFLPIDFFKRHTIKAGAWKEEKIFKSSGTTSSQRSKHYVKNINFYLNSTLEIFRRIVGPIEDFQVAALLPSYQLQGDSSLICMVDHMIDIGGDESQYILNLDSKKILESDQRKVLFGVSYALWDLAESDIKPKNSLIIETGGMKGRKREIIRDELHSILKRGLSQNLIWSEYGMTELLSQAYGPNGHFEFPPWAKVLIRDINDPFNYLKNGKSGGINVIDLANVDTCCFIETQDLGRQFGGFFEVLGRFDNSDIRGCNLMI